MKRLIASIFAILMLMNIAPYNAKAAADCASLRKMACDDPKLKPGDIQDCINRGWDPPVSCIPNPGAGRTGAVGGGSGGYTMRTIQAPEMPPKTAGAKPSTSSASISFALTFPPWSGGSCLSGGASSSCVGSTTSSAGTTDTSVCPVNADTTGQFGPTTAFSAAQTLGLSCGGTMPLTNYRITLVTNPLGMTVTEYNQPYIWIYKAGSGSYSQVGGAAQPLPKLLCEWYTDSLGNKKKRPSHNPPYSLAPMGQMITYNGNTQSIALRVVQQTPDANSNPFAASNQNEKYLILPISGGVPYIPKDDASNDYSNCDIQDDYFKPYSVLKGTSLSGDVVIESSMQPGCEATAAVCKTLGQSQSPSSVPNCETTTLNPKGTISTTAGNVVCDGKIQYMVLDHPNLYFPPGTNASVMPIQGRTAYMVSTNSGNAAQPARLVDTSDTVIHFNQSPNSFTLLSGGVLGLANGNRLTMSGPATIDMNGLTVMLTAGGEEDTTGGTPIGSFNAGSSFSIDPSLLPITITLEKDMAMPANYMIPSEPAGFVRQPVTPPQ